MQRLECYNLIIEIFANFDADANDAERYSEKIEVIRKALQSSDKDFHYAVYDYFISSEKEELMLEFQTPFIDSYLNEEDIMENQNILLELLWKYYARHSRYMSAARTLFKLASKPNLNLQQRLQYLTNTVTMASSDHDRDQNELAHFSDTLDVAKIQYNIMKPLAELVSTTGDISLSQKIEELNSRLFVLQELYEISDQYNLYENCLDILFAADQGVTSLQKSKILWGIQFSDRI